MEEFKKVIEELIITSLEEVMLQTGLEKYEVLKLAKECGYVIDYQGYFFDNNSFNC